MISKFYEILRPKKVQEKYCKKDVAKKCEIFTAISNIQSILQTNGTDKRQRAIITIGMYADYITILLPFFNEFFKKVYSECMLDNILFTT